MGRAPAADERIVGRYALYGEIASGGMASVHFGRLIGPVGFCRTVAIKRLHPQFAKDPEFVSMFLDEARLAGRIQHPNVVATLDVVPLEGELFLVMEYVQGESLARVHRAVQRAGIRIPVEIVASFATNVLYGLHSAHEAVDERGAPLRLVHRDVSPQNILIGSDGVARVLDFGVAKAAGRLQTTREGQLKGKLAYMAPEQLGGTQVDRRVDIYGLAVVMWEALAGHRLFEADNEGLVFGMVLNAQVPPPSYYRPEVPPALDHVVLRGLARDPATRFPTAHDMAVAIEECVKVASPRVVGSFVTQVAGASLAKRAARVKEIESFSSPSGSSVMSFPPASTPDPTTASRSVMGARFLGADGEAAGSVSKVTNVTMSTGRRSMPSGRRATSHLVVLASALVGALATIIGVAVVRQARQPSPAASDLDSASPSSAPVTAVADPTPARSAAPDPTPSAPSAAAPIASASAPIAIPAAPAKAALAAPRAHKQRPADAPALAPAAPAPAADRCNPPFTVDAEGIRHIKPECM